MIRTFVLNGCNITGEELARQLSQQGGTRIGCTFQPDLPWRPEASGALVSIEGNQALAHLARTGKEVVIALFDDHLGPWLGYLSTIATEQ